jgi:hypothetical protein
VNGLLRFHRGVELEIKGEVVRVQSGSVALRLTACRIPSSIILAEQKEPVRRNPMVDGASARSEACAAAGPRRGYSASFPAAPHSDKERAPRCCEWGEGRLR